MNHQTFKKYSYFYTVVSPEKNKLWKVLKYFLMNLCIVHAHIILTAGQKVPELYWKVECLSVCDLEESGFDIH